MSERTSFRSPQLVIFSAGVERSARFSVSLGFAIPIVQPDRPAADSP